MSTRIRVCLLLVLISAPGLSGADFAMKVTDKNYLDTRGFSVFLYVGRIYAQVLRPAACASVEGLAAVTGLRKA
jgi:hypothetical protein